MKIKHYDADLQKWVIDGVSNSSDLELSNPAYLDDEGNSISADEGFTKVANKLKKIEDNLAWIYINGAHGGGGGGGPGTGDTITIQVIEGDTIYTSTSVARFNILIDNGTVPRQFTIVIKDVNTGRTLTTLKKYSLSRIPIEIFDLTGNVNLEITAYDSVFNYALPTYLSVVYGAIGLTLQTTPPKTIIRGAITDVPANFTLRNNITGASSAFVFKVNGITISEQTNITISPRSFNFNLREIIFNSGIFPNINTGDKFYFEAYASTILNGTEIRSEVIKFDLTAVEANSLVIVTNNISENNSDYEAITQFPQGSQLNFTYYLSYAPTKYNAFNVDYDVFLMSGNTKVSETPLLSGRIPNIVKNNTNTFSLSTVNLPINEEEGYLMIELNASAVSDPGDNAAKFTKQVYAVVREAEQVDLYANNKIQTLLAYFSRVTGFPSSSETNWRYNLSSTGTFPYTDIFASQFPNGVNLKLNKTNGYSSGFLNNTDGINNIPGIVLNGEASAHIEVAQQMFPDYEIGSFGFFQPKGFNISTTYKTDTMTDVSRVVMSIGRYRNDLLDSGIEITLDQITVKIGTADTISVKLPQNELITVDIDVSLVGNGWYFKIYVNGVLSAVSRVEQSAIDWTFEEDLYFGCRNDNGILSRFSNVTIHDIKLYTSSQSDFAIVQNYISATEQAKLISGQIDPSLDAELRSKNLFNSEGKCLLWNDSNDEFYQGEQLYSILSSEIETSTPYPIVMIRESANSATDFKAFSTAIFSADQKHEIMDETFPCEIIFKNKLGESLIRTPDGVSASEGVRIGLQGTSSLSYNAKNFELYMGNMNAAGKPLLFQPMDEWLPENEFTLKADVMDSAHVNNVVIGKIVNGEVTNSSGVPVEPLAPTPPMLLPESVFATPEIANEIRSKIKHTSDGFPCLVFVDFAPDRITGVRETRFMGIYNFNLGRYAHFNLGLKILTDYSKVTTGGMPTLIEDYDELETHWNTSQAAGVYSMEINQNHSAQGAFQQDDMGIIKFMADSIYSSQDADRSYDAVKKFYSQMANMALSQTQKYTMDDAGQTPTKPIPGEYYNYNSSYYNFSELDLHMNWNNANSYFIIALLFGMVDSMAKNLTLRSWGGNTWYTSFYDMDTAFGLNNSGQDTVEYWAHLHRWYNIQAADTGITTFTLERNYTNLNPEGIKQFFASTWNRIWEVLENLPIRDSGGLSEARTTLSKTYANLRLNLFPDPDEFINKYYKSYTEQTGSIMFNYDYNVKYLKVAQTYNNTTGEFEDTTDFSQLKFLHGNRVIHVKDWFKKRVLFLDGVYGVDGNTSLLDPVIKSPANQMWSDNKASGVGSQVLFDINMSSSSKILYRWSYDKTNGSFWLDDNNIPAVVPTPGGETIIYMYANKHITKFDNFKSYPWTSITNIDLPLLKELDLSGVRNVPSENFLYPKVYDSISDKGLKSIERLILNNVQLTNASAYTLDVRECKHLNYLDISNSNITAVNLSDSAVLKYYNLSGTSIRTLNISNQSFLETLVLDDCLELTEITINNCNSLRNLNLPPNVAKVSIINCELLTDLNIPYYSSGGTISKLETIIIDNCPGLKTFNISGQNNQELNVNLVGAWNLEALNLSNVATQNILLPSLYIDGVPNFNSLRSIDISNTRITDFIYNDNPKDLDGSFIRKDYLDLLHFNNLNFIRASNNSMITEIRGPNHELYPIALGLQAFINCTSLNRIKGHFSIEGQDVFKNCNSFKLNDEDVYQTSLPGEFLEGDSVTNLSINSSSLRGVFENCALISYNDFKFIIAKFNSSIISVEAMFKGCSNITGEIWRDLFTRSRNIETIKEFVANTGISGTLVSRSNSYSITDETTWGFLDYLPILKDLEAAFEGSLLEWIDNNLFQPKNGVSYNFLNIDRMFRFCGRLKTCADTRQSIKVYGRLNSKTFFTSLRNLISTYPKNVFEGTNNIDMDIINEGDNTYLFHTLNVVTHNILDNSLYAGVNLFGEIKVNVFGGISNTFTDGTTTYYIPKFTSIQYPFTGTSNNLTIDLGQMGSIFRNIGSTLLQAVGIFSGMNCIGTKKIPNDIFQGCTSLNSIESLFSNLNIDNEGQVYEFPNSIIFNDTISLKNIKNLFSNTRSLKIKLVGEGFKNCVLEDVSGAFSSSGVFGIIPYRLFFMNNGNSIRQTIKNMSGIFSNCWLLGYSSDRVISEDTLLETINYPDGSTYSLYTSWDDNIVKTPGTKMSYKLDVTDMVKTYNYDRDENIDIPNPNYIANPDNRPEDYDVNTPETIPNPDYNPGEYAFDIWYLDGHGWEGATALNSGDASELVLQKDRLQRYFIYDTYQKQAIQDHIITEWYINTNQNYMIPTDLFRYCHKDATLTNVLNSLSWRERIVEVDPATNKGKVVLTNNIQGLSGRIPSKIFNSLSENPELNAVFENTYFDPFYGLRGTNANSLTRGLMYPPDLFKKNTELNIITNMFAGTTIHVGVDINSDLFVNNSKLRNVSGVWANCKFDKRLYNYESAPPDAIDYSQINFSEIFRGNIRITNASNLFAVTDISETNRGLLVITPDLLRSALQINNVSNMFYYNTNLSGAVPLFQSSIYTALNSTFGYLVGVSRYNITNADLLEPRLIPLGWD